MTTETDDISRADRLSRRRARMMPALAAVFMVQQAAFFTGQAEGAARTVDYAKAGAWMLLSVVLLLALATGGFWFYSKRVRTLLNDEVARANRVDAQRFGFVAAMAAGLALYALSWFEPLAGREAVHLLMTVGIAAGLLRFGQLERRAHRDG